MFKFLKEKLSAAISKFSRKAEEETQQEEPKEEKKEKKEQKRAKEHAPAREKKQEKRQRKPEQAEGEKELRIAEPEEPEHKEEKTRLIRREEKEEKEPERKSIEVYKEAAQEPGPKLSFFGRLKEAITTKALSEEKFATLFEDLELALLENNVALEVIDKLRADLKAELVDKKILRGEISDIVKHTLDRSLDGLFSQELNLITAIKQSGKKPYIIVFFGVNGSGKTTTIAKLAYQLQKNGLSCVMAAADTFRAAAIQQLEEHADRTKTKLIKHAYGADPAAVAFDAIKYAEAKGIDVVLIDTAGRQHSNTNLMDEMKKIVRVAKPDLRVFIGESITGNDCAEQARAFNEAIGFDAMILTKLDVDEKGGAFVSVSYITKKPIVYVGLGQGYDDLKPFSKDLVMKNLGLEA